MFRSRRRPSKWSRTPEKWDVEDEQFWATTGKKIANRNLWVSIPQLLLGFSVWICWGMIAKYIQKLHFANPELFNFTFLNDGAAYDAAGYRGLLFTLPAVAGLVGATLRIPNSFMIAICGGRNVKFMTTLLLILPALGAGHRAAEPRYAVLHLHCTRGTRRSRRWSVCLLDVQHQLLLSQEACRDWRWASTRASVTSASASCSSSSLGHDLGLCSAVLVAIRSLQLVGEGGSTPVWIQNAGLVWVPILVTAMILAFGSDEQPAVPRSADRRRWQSASTSG